MIARTRVLLGAATVLVLMPPGALASRLLRSAPRAVVGSRDDLVVRRDATGNRAYVRLGKSIEQLQPMMPGTSRASLATPELRQQPLRMFASGSLDAPSLPPPSFGGFGAMWIILRMPRLNRGGAGGTAVWELHTNGLKTPGVSIAALPGS